MILTDYISAAPEMILLGLICVVLIADLFVDDEHRLLTFWMSIAALVITIWSLLFVGLWRHARWSMFMKLLPSR